MVSKVPIIVKRTRSEPIRREAHLVLSDDSLDFRVITTAEIVGRDALELLRRQLCRATKDSARKHIIKHVGKYQSCMSTTLMAQRQKGGTRTVKLLLLVGELGLHAGHLRLHLGFQRRDLIRMLGLLLFQLLLHTHTRAARTTSKEGKEGAI